MAGRVHVCGAIVEHFIVTFVARHEIPAIGPVIKCALVVEQTPVKMVVRKLVIIATRSYGEISLVGTVNFDRYMGQRFSRARTYDLLKHGP